MQRFVTKVRTNDWASPAWRCILDSCMKGQRDYIVPLVRHCNAECLEPADMTNGTLAAWTESAKKYQQRPGYLNTIINICNATGRLPALKPWPTTRAQKALRRISLPSELMDELDRYQITLRRKKSIKPQTCAAIDRRLQCAALEFLKRDGFRSFEQCGEPERLAAFVESYEPDPNSLQYTPNEARRRALGEIVSLCDALGYADLRGKIDDFGLPRAGLDLGVKVAAILDEIDDPAIDQARQQYCVQTILQFARKPTRAGLVAAQVALIILVAEREVLSRARALSLRFAGPLRDFHVDESSIKQRPTLVVDPRNRERDIRHIEVSTHSQFSQIVDAYWVAALHILNDEPSIVFVTRDGVCKKACTLSVQVGTLSQRFGPKLTITAIRDRQIQKNIADGLDRDGVRDLSCASTTDNAYYRYRGFTRRSDATRLGRPA